MDHSKTIRDIVIVFIISVLTGIFAYILRIYIAKTYSVEDYGLLYAMISFFSLLIIFVDIGLHQSMIKEVAKYRVQNKAKKIKDLLFTAFIVQTVLAIIISTILLLLSNAINMYFFHNTNSIFFYIFLFWMLTYPLTFFVFAYLLGFEKTTWWAILELSKIIFILILSLIMYSFNHSIISVFIGYALSNIFIILLFVIFRPDFFSPFNFNFSYALVYPRLIKYGLYILIGASASILLSQTDTLMVTFFLGLKEAGIYQAAVPLASILTTLIAPTTTVLLAKISNLWAQKKIDEIESLLLLVQKYILILVLPITSVLTFFAYLILKILFTIEYVSATHSLMILSVAFMISAISSILTFTLISIGYAKKVMYIVVFGAIINLIGNFFLIKIFNITGAALSTLFSSVVMFFMLRYYLGKKINFAINYVVLSKTFFSIALFIASLFVCKSIIHTNYLLEAGIGIFISGMVYLLALFTTKVITKEDILFIKNMLKLKKVSTSVNHK